MPKMNINLYHEHANGKDRDILVDLQIFPYVRHQSVIIFRVFDQILLEELERTTRPQKCVQNDISHEDYEPNHKERISYEIPE